MNDQELIELLTIHLQQFKAQPLLKNEQEQAFTLTEELKNLQSQFNAANGPERPQLLQQIQDIQSILANLPLNFSHSEVSPFFAFFQVEEKGAKKNFYLGHETRRFAEFQLLDWRTSPYSLIYFKYHEGDDYVEDFSDDLRQLEKDGRLVVKCALKVDAGKLVQVRRGEKLLLAAHREAVPRNSATSFLELDFNVRTDAVLALRTKKFLPDITALLSPQQFKAIQMPPGSVMILYGVAGSGKTTVALHRLAWLIKQQNLPVQQRVSLKKSAIFVQTKALSLYIRELLYELLYQNFLPVVLDNFYNTLFQHIFPKNFSTAEKEIHSSELLTFKKSRAYQSYLDEAMVVWEETFDCGLQAILPKAGLMWPKEFFDQPILKKLWLAWGIYTAVEEQPQSVRGLSTSFVQSLGELLGNWLELDLDYRDPSNFLFSLFHKVFDDFVMMEQLAQQVFGQAPSARLVVQRLKDDFLAVGNYLDVEFTTDKKAKTLCPWDGEDQITLVYFYQKYFEPLPNRLLPLFHGDIAADLKRRNKPHPLFGNQLSSWEELWSVSLGNHELPLELDLVVIDEVQDLSLLELEIFHHLTEKKSNLVLAGDLNQKIYHGGGLNAWEELPELFHKAKPHFEKLEVSYRTTKEILEFAVSLLPKENRPLSATSPKAGNPVKLFQFTERPALIQFVVEWLVRLSEQAPLLSVCLLFHEAELAEDFYRQVERFEVPKLRLVEDQEFRFLPGFDVTTVADVKGLEYDFVLVFYTDKHHYPDTPYARRLLHTACTRASMELALVFENEPSPILPDSYKKQLVSL